MRHSRLSTRVFLLALCATTMVIAQGTARAQNRVPDLGSTDRLPDLGTDVADEFAPSDPRAATDPFGDGDGNDGQATAAPVFDDLDDETVSSEATTDPRPAPTDTGARLRPARRAQPVGTPNADGTTTRVSNAAAAPVQGSAPDATLGRYDPLGIRLGAFTLLPSIEQTIGVTSNGALAPGGEAATFSQTDVDAAIVSDWSRHELRGAVSGSYRTFIQGEGTNLPQLDADASFRYDVSRETALTAGVTYDIRTESPTSDNLAIPVGVTLDDRPIVQRGSVFLEGARRGAKLFGSLRGTVSRDLYENAALSDGTVIDQSDRAETRYGVSARVGYEVSPAIRPFIEGGAALRVRDSELDSNGNARSGADFDLRGGIAFDLGPKLSGTASAGFLTRTYDDAVLDTLTTPVLAAEIAWSPRALTTVTASATTTLIDSTDADEEASRLYAGALGISRDVRDNLTIDALGRITVQDFKDGRDDVTYTAEVGALWRLNRVAAITARAAYENQTSTDPNVEYDALSARIGLRLQK